MSSGGSVRVPKVLLENLQKEVERLRGQLIDSPAELVDREKLRDRFVEASAPLWALVQHVRPKEHLSKRFLDASSPLWTLVQDQADEVDQARQQVARAAEGEGLARADHWLDQLYGHLETDDRGDSRAESSSLEREPEFDEERGDSRNGDSTLDPPSASPLKSPQPVVSHLSAHEAVGRLFVAWCMENRLLVSRSHLFEAQLRKGFSPDARLESVYRKRDGGAVEFGRDPAVGPEYWLVRTGEVLLLLPQPVRSDQFRELAPVFAGQAVPATLVEVTPATATQKGDVFTLMEPGAIAAQATPGS